MQIKPRFLPRCFRRIIGSIVGTLILTLSTTLIGCNNNRSVEPLGSQSTLPFEYEVTGEDFLISALDELEAIAEWARSPQGAAPSTGDPSAKDKLVLSKTEADTVFIYGQLTSDGYGAVVTERHAYPKGIPLITVRKTHGGANGRLLTQTMRYVSIQDFHDDKPQQATITSVVGLSSDTILTRVFRNGTLDTYTFRLPVVTRVVSSQDGSVRVTSRFGANGTVVSEITDGTGQLIERRINSGTSDGSVVTKTEYPDGSWRSVRTLGLADGTIFKEITSGS